MYLVDLASCLGAMMAAYMLRLGVLELPDRPMQISLVFAMAAWTASAIYWGIYNSIFRYAGSGAVLNLGRATLTNCIILVATLGMGFIPGVPRTVAVIQPFILLLVLFISRLLIRYLLIDVMQQFDFVGDLRRILIYGAGAAGQQLARSLRHEPGLLLIGYVDDNDALSRRNLDGIPIFHPRTLADRVEEFDVSDILIALPSISRQRRQEIVASLQELGVHVLILPGMQQIVDRKVSFRDLSEVKLEDLLGRAPVPPDAALLAEAIAAKTILVTGAGGSIGSELCRQILEIGPRQLILAEVNEFALYSIERELRAAVTAGGLTTDIVPELVNVANRQSVDRLYQSYRPTTVFHAAAYKHVPLVEANPLSGLGNNVFGTLYCAQAAERFEVERFVLVSTDKAVRPTNLMGASKRVCELVLQALSQRGSKTRFAMVRFGNVLGSSGSVVPLFNQQIARGGPVTLTHREMTRYFMTIPEAALLVIQAGAMAQGGEVYVLDMGEPVRIIDMARNMIRLSGLSIKDEANPAGDIEIVEVGLRPGEKLYEELLIGDDPQLTSHPRIMQARERSLPWSEVERALAEIDAELQAGRGDGAKQIVLRIVPEYDDQGLTNRRALAAS